jgi:hypothetical protein
MAKKGQQCNVPGFVRPYAGKKSFWDICKKKKRAQNQICPTKRRKTHLTPDFFQRKGSFLNFLESKSVKKKIDVKKKLNHV